MRKSKVMLMASVILVGSLFNIGNAEASTEKDIAKLTKAFDTNITNHISEFTVSISFNGNESVAEETIKDMIDSKKKSYGDILFLIDKLDYTKKCNAKNKKCDVKFKLKFTADRTEYKQYRESLIKLASDKQDLSVEDKMKFVNKHIKAKSSHTTNNKGKRKSLSPVKIFKEGLGDSQAYSIYTHNLLNELGVENYIIVGMVEGSIHFWNVLRNDKGSIVHMDTTLNDMFNTDEYLAMPVTEIMNNRYASINMLKETTTLLRDSIEDIKPYSKPAVK